MNTEEKPVKPEITNWWAIKRGAVARLGQEEFDRRVVVARAVARKIADDPSWFAGDDDREGVFTFMAHRLTSLAVQLGNEKFAKFEGLDHDTLGIAVCRMIEDGVMI